MGDAVTPGLTVETWLSVSSMEWPIVVFGYCARQLDTNKQLRQKDQMKNEYVRYRALSRATTKAIEITC